MAAAAATQLPLLFVRSYYSLITKTSLKRVIEGPQAPGPIVKPFRRVPRVLPNGRTIPDDYLRRRIRASTRKSMPSRLLVAEPRRIIGVSVVRVLRGVQGYACQSVEVATSLCPRTGL